MNGSRVIYTILSLIIVSLPWFWIPNGYAYTSEEPNFINYDIKMDRADSMWTKDGALGAPGDPSNQSLLIPNAIFYKTAKNIGLDGSETQKLFLSFILLSTIVSFNLFSSLFTKNIFIKFLGLIFYLFNFYMVTSIGYTAKTIQMVLLPLLFYLTTMLLRTKKSRYFFYNFISVFIFQGVFTNLPTAIVSLSVYFFSFIYHLISIGGKDLFASIKQVALILISITPILIQHATIYMTVLSEMSDKPALFTFAAIGAPLSLLLQFRGVWWERSGHMGIDYFNLWPFYGNVFVSVVTIVCVAVIILLSLESTYMGARNKSKQIIYWLLLFLLGIGFSSGFYFFPGLYQWLLDHFPPMVMFREPWAKFIPLVVFPLSALVVVTLDQSHRHNKKCFIVLAVLLCLHLSVQSYPYFSGKIIDSEVVGWKRRVVKVPEYWEEYASWTKENPGTVLAIPFGITPYNSYYNWYESNLGNSVMPMPCILGKSNILCESQVDMFTEYAKESINKKNLDFVKLGYVNYILVQDDIKILDSFDKFLWQATAAAEYLKDMPIASFGGKLKIFQVKDEFIKPIIYTISDDSPSSSFVKINQTQYQVEVDGVNKPFTLIFNQAFNKNWRLLNQNGHAIPNTDHIAFEKFVNGWNIDPKKICQTTPCQTRFTIEFEPQKTYKKAADTAYLFFKISLLVILSIFIKAFFQKK